jgi:hypothetical protein
MPYCLDVDVVWSVPPGAIVREYADHVPDSTRGDWSGIGTVRLFLGEQLFTGRAKVIMTNVHTGGDYYEGDYAEGMEHGHGVYTNVVGQYTGMAQTGNWDMGIMSGEGRLEYVPEYEGRRTVPEFVGQYVNNIKHGRGILTYPYGMLHYAPSLPICCLLQSCVHECRNCLPPVAN